jgi:hypothetical protein
LIIFYQSWFWFKMQYILDMRLRLCQLTKSLKVQFQITVSLSWNAPNHFTFFLTHILHYSLDLDSQYHMSSCVRVQLCKLQKGYTRLAAASDKVYQLLSQGQWFSPGTPASSTTKTGRHSWNIAESGAKRQIKKKNQYHMSSSLSVFSELRWEMIVCFVHIDGIVDNYCLNFLSIIIDYVISVVH